jgi:uncharacterized protein YbjT (DUF2867 family)
MKILVTGGTGFVGREVLRQLQAAGHQARILVRDTKSAADRLPQPTCVTEFHRGDVTDLRSLTGAAKGCDAVIHLVGIISEFGPVTFERLHVEATRNLVATTQADGVTRFIHMSALGTRPEAPARYHQTKWAAEEIVRTSGLNFTILQPSVIYGREDHFVNLFAQMARRMPFVPVMGPGTALLQPVAVECVARCFVRALSETGSIGGTYEVCGPERLSAVALVDAVLAATGRKRFKLHIPMPVARFQALLLEGVVGAFLHKPPPLTRDQLRMLQEDNVGDAGPATRLFGLRQVPFEEGIRAYLRRQEAAE